MHRFRPFGMICCDNWLNRACVVDALLASSNLVFTIFLLPRSGWRGNWWPAACPVSIRRAPRTADELIPFFPESLSSRLLGLPAPLGSLLVLAR